MVKELRNLLVEHIRHLRITGKIPQMASYSLPLTLEIDNTGFEVPFMA